MTRPSLPIDINTQFPITIGNFSEISEEDTNYNPIQLLRNESYVTFEPEIINGCCCTFINNIWYNCLYEDRRYLIITDTPKVYVRYNESNDFTNCYYLDNVPISLSSTLSHLEINILITPDIFITPPTSTTDKFVFSILLYFDTYITFSFVIEASNDIQTIFLDYVEPKWTLSTNSSTLYLPYASAMNEDYSHVVYTTPINKELNRMNIFGGQGVLSENNSLVTEIGSYVGTRNGEYDNNYMPIFEVVGGAF